MFVNRCSKIRYTSTIFLVDLYISLQISLSLQHERLYNNITYSHLPHTILFFPLKLNDTDVKRGTNNFKSSRYHWFDQAWEHDKPRAYHKGLALSKNIGYMFLLHIKNYI